jgi:hypothetical protein
MSVLEERVRDALHAAAQYIEPQSAPLGAQPSQKRTRWAAPVAAAAAVLGVVAVSLIATSGHKRQRIIDQAAETTLSTGSADVGGVRFPVPDGWTVKVVVKRSSLIRACVAADPTVQCDGVTLTVALPQGPPLPSEDVVQCSGSTTNAFIQVENPDGTVGGRPGQHYYGSCGPHGPVAQQWCCWTSASSCEPRPVDTPQKGRRSPQGWISRVGRDRSASNRSIGRWQIHCPRLVDQPQTPVDERNNGCGDTRFANSCRIPVDPDAT